MAVAYDYDSPSRSICQPPLCSLRSRFQSPHWKCPKNTQVHPNTRTGLDNQSCLAFLDCALGRLGRTSVTSVPE